MISWQSIPKPNAVDAIISRKLVLLLQNSVTIASRILTSDAAVNISINLNFLF